MKDYPLDDLIERAPSPWMTVQEAANYLRVGTHTIYAYMRENVLDRYYIGPYRSTRVKRADIEAMVQEAADEEQESGKVPAE